MDSPVGRLMVTAADGAITRLRWLSQGGAEKRSPPPTPNNTVLAVAMEQLRNYFDDPSHIFDLPLAPSGSPFQKAVWQVMCTIQSGAVLTYGAVAAQVETSELEASQVETFQAETNLGKKTPQEQIAGAEPVTPGLAQAVGRACGANPIPIIIPCHRIVAARDKLGGFSGGQGRKTKEWLLTHEKWPGIGPGPLFAGLQDEMSCG